MQNNHFMASRIKHGNVRKCVNKPLAIMLAMLIFIGMQITPGVSALTGFTELTGGLTVSSTQTVTGSEGRRAVTGHTYIDAIFGTTGWASSGYTWNSVDYRAAFDAPVGDGQSGSQYFDGAKEGYAGVEFKTPQLVTQIGFRGRQANNRLDGAWFQGSDDKTTWKTLYTIEGSNYNSFEYRSVANGLIADKAYKYFRITGHAGMPDVMNIYELKLYTHSNGNSVLDMIQLKTSTREDIALPATFLTYDISWTSKTPDIMDGAGHIVVDESGRPANATLTASMVYNGTTCTRDITVRILPASGLGLDGMILHLSFDDNAISARAGQGTANGTITYTQGVSGTAAVFNGNASNYISARSADGTPLLTGLTEFTVSFWLRQNSTSGPNWWFYAAPNTTAQTNNQEKYVGIIGNTTWTYQRFNNSGSRPSSASTSTIAGKWVHMTITNEASRSRMFINGQQVASQNSSVNVATMLGSSSIMYIGRANWTSSGESAAGAIDEYMVFNRVLSDTEIKDLYNDYVVINPFEIKSVSCPGERTKQIVIDNDNRSVTLPVFPSADRSNLAVEINFDADMAAISPDPATVRDYSSPVKYTMTSKVTGETAGITINVPVYGNPVLKDLHADPQTYSYGGKYYIYSTTDGYSGWGGYTMEVWESEDLVNWVNKGIVLDARRGTAAYNNINGVAVGIIPWSTGNLWAPGFIEKDGTFYLYFSANYPTGNVKNIGVATSNSPLGPFTPEPNFMLQSSDTVNNSQSIDPCVFKDPVSGDYFIYFGQSVLTGYRLNPNMKSVETATKTRISLTNFMEGIYVIYNEAGSANGNYYFSWSQNSTESEDYRVNYGITNNPLGSRPYSTSSSSPSTISGSTLILSKDTSKGILGTGHHAMLNIPGTDKWFICYHRFQRFGGNGQNRETCIDELRFNANGTIATVVPTLEGILYPVRVGENPDLSYAAYKLELYGIDDIRHNITLPLTGERNTTITWKSGDPAIISDKFVDGKAPGVVNRPLGDGTVEVTLTAVISDSAGGSVEKDFKATVRLMDPNLDKDYTAGYVWSYFNSSNLKPTGSTGTTNSRYKIFYGFSTDGLHWNSINRIGSTQYPVAESVVGYQGVRDPHIIRSYEGDKYWILGTDLQDGFDTANGSKGLIIWESYDMINWTQSRYEQVFAYAGNCWAPEAMYDEEAGDYLVYWASTDQRQSGNSNALRQYVCRTRDFHTFTEPVVWANEHDNTSSKKNCIDATLAYVNGNYYRFMTSDWNTVVDYSPTLSTNMSDWTKLMTRGTHTSYGLESVEGFTVYRLPDGRWNAMGDNSAYRGYWIEEEDFHTLRFTKNATTGTNSRSNTFYNGTSTTTFRHGTVMRLSKTEEKALLEACPGVAYSDAPRYSVYVKNGTSNPFVTTQGTNVSVAWVSPGTGINFRYWYAEGIELTAAQTTSQNISFAMPGGDVRLYAITNRPATSFEIDTKSLDLTPGDHATIMAAIAPTDADRAVIWSSSDPSVAVVDANGKVTALKPGKAVITVISSATTSFSETCAVTVVSKDISVDSRVRIYATEAPDGSGEAFDPVFKVEADGDIVMRVLVARYNANGTLAGVSATQVISLSAGDKSTFQASIAGGQAGATYRFFIWDDDYLPLTGVTTIEGLSYIIS